MTNLLTRIKRGGMRPIRRVLSLDAGSRQIRILLGEAGFGRFRVIKQERIDLQEEGLVSADEVQSHLSLLIRDWGTPPLALVLPQHISTSQILDLPSAPDSEIERAIQDETLKLAGVSESRIIYDFVEAPGAPPNRQQFWVTLCQERA
ncbi:MAG TPA: hypothetical protein VHH88_00875, partial [Verrucomicrobiae bacterium]|nr:hypothetical protein [Verrucomicrobiae bacterium]